MPAKHDLGEPYDESRESERLQALGEQTGQVAEEASEVCVSCLRALAAVVFTLFALVFAMPLLLRSLPEPLPFACLCVATVLLAWFWVIMGQLGSRKAVVGAGAIARCDLNAHPDVAWAITGWFIPIYKDLLPDLLAAMAISDTLSDFMSEREDAAVRLEGAQASV